MSFLQVAIMMNQATGADQLMPDKERLEMASVSGEEPTLIIYLPTTGEALDPDSIQYKAIYQFLNIDTPAPTGMCQYQNTNLQEPPPK